VIARVFLCWFLGRDGLREGPFVTNEPGLFLPVAAEKGMALEVKPYA
jgi:hypothetical protein